MARIEWIHHRLERWSMWVARGRGASSAGSACHPMWRGARVDGEVREPVVPINEQECWKTEAAIKALPSPLAETVAQYYLNDSARARKVLCISSSVLSQRLDRAHVELSRIFTQQGAIETAPEPSWYQSVSQ